MWDSQPGWFGRVTWFWVAGRKRKNIINVRSIEESGLTFFSGKGVGGCRGAVQPRHGRSGLARARGGPDCPSADVCLPAQLHAISLELINHSSVR